MSEIKTGGPAFPTEVVYKQSEGIVFDGLSIRDYFAAKALPMMMDFSAEFGAAEAYKWADAMLKAREK